MKSLRRLVSSRGRGLYFLLKDDAVQLRSAKIKGPPLRELTSSSCFPFEVGQPELFTSK